MKRWIVLDLGIFLVLGILSLLFAPDVFSLIIISVMFVVIAAAFSKGMWLVLNLADGFRTAAKHIHTVKDITAADKWNTFRQAESVFQQPLLDRLWNEYKQKCDAQQQESLLISDAEELINEEVLALYSWKSVVLQIPGSLTALGLIGTFLGLILGISGIAFSSVDAAISSITTLLSGIETAFYTSIIGVILSMVFNISYKLAWNALLHEMGIFFTEFHKYILPDEESRTKQSSRSDMEKILSCLERIPKGSDYFNCTSLTESVKDPEAGEKILMTEIWESLKNDDFTFFIQPRCDLASKQILGGEALMRWNHRRLGIVSPTVFLPALEKNGYIVQLDRRMWENVCKTIRNWMDRGIRPVPVSVNVSKMDLLVMDVAQVFSDLVKQYQVPPQYIQMEIAENAYIQSAEMAYQAEEKLRQAGFHVIINGARGEYDTLNLLTESKADALKLEYRMLSEKQAGDPQALAEIVEQSHKTRIKLIASGIENAKQLTTLKKAGFHEGQGFFLHKPLDAKAFEELLERS